MGWKTFKQHFGIAHHVCVDKDRVLIGSGYVSDLASIDRTTGVVMPNGIFPDFLEKHYPSVLAARPEDILQLLEAEDTFSAAITVFTFEDGKVVEKLCEATGWPNVTHDGRLMYNNTFSTEKVAIVAAARNNAEGRISLIKREIQKTEQQLADLRAELAKQEAELAALKSEYPSE